MPITLKNLQTKTSLNLRQIKSLLSTTLDVLGISEADVSFVFVTHQKMRALNRRYHNLRNSTDVLSFDLSDTEQSRMQGEVVISPDAARAYIRQHGGDLATELMLYMVHGLLHLAGYDDHRPVDIQRMRAKELDILRILGPKVKTIVGVT